MVKRFGYWVFGSDMKTVNLETLKKYGVTDIFLNFYVVSPITRKKTKKRERFVLQS